MPTNLINNAAKYIGKHVAIESFEKKDVIVYGDNADTVREKAKETCDNPIILYIPDRRDSKRP